MRTAIIAFFLLASHAFAGSPISFRELPKGDTIHVQFTSLGCFHDESYEFSFRREETYTATVTRVGGRWDAKGKRNETAKGERLGSVTLSKEEVAGLDRLLKYYRAKPPGGCTTMDRISVRQMNGDTVKAREGFEDASCATYDMKSVTRFLSLVARLEPEDK